MQETSTEERNWALFCHLSALAVFVIPDVGGLIGPLVVWLVKRNEFPLVDDQGKESLNFQITMAIIGFFVLLLGVGGFVGGIIHHEMTHAGPDAAPVAGLIAWFGMFLVLGILAIFDLISVIVATVRASSGQRYRYPIAIRFIR